MKFWADFQFEFVTHHHRHRLPDEADFFLRQLTVWLIQTQHKSVELIPQLSEKNIKCLHREKGNVVHLRTDGSSSHHNRLDINICSVVKQKNGSHFSKDVSPWLPWRRDETSIFSVQWFTFYVLLFYIDFHVNNQSPCLLSDIKHTDKLQKPSALEVRGDSSGFRHPYLLDYSFSS